MILVVGGEKGGTGKSTLSTNIAACLANAGKDVVLVDVDPQGTSSRWKDRRDAFIAANPGVKIGTVHCVRKTGEVIPTLKDLASRYEYVIVDAGGHDSKELRGALVVANMLYSPLLPSLPDIETLEFLNEVIGQGRASVNPELQAILLVSKASSNPFINEALEAKEFLEGAFEHFALSPTIIVERVAYRKAFFDGLGVTDVVPKKNFGDAKAEIQLLVAEIFGDVV